MEQVTQILNRIERGEAQAASELLPLVYDELRKLATRKLAQERPGQTLQATALVHEAYLRLVGEHPVPQVQASGGRQSPVGSEVEDCAVKENRWDNRGHFFAAAAEAMRRILVENARHKKRLKYGGELIRVELSERDLACHDNPDDLLALNEALQKLAAEDATAEKVANLRLFAGLSVEEAGAALGLSRANAYRHWTYAKAWLTDALRDT